MRLLRWYDRHRRDLPWRARAGERADPYRVWLSEVMLQQTSVAAVGPYFARFLDAFPTVEALAAAPAERVMRLWAGLGYYARARNLHRAAQAVAAAGGRFPETEAGLRALPGIGRYTAAAIAAIAYRRPAVAVDGNVERVMARLFAAATPLPAAKPALAALAQGLGAQRPARARPGDFIQALFDLGAGICTPRKPLCPLCPWREDCAARAHGIAESLPAKAPKSERPRRHGIAFWIEDRDGAVLLRRRPARGLLGGMPELPGTEWRAARWTLAEALAHAPHAPGARWRLLPAEARHVFSHFELGLGLALARVARIVVPGGHWLVPRAGLLAEGFPTAIAKAVRLGLAEP